MATPNLGDGGQLSVWCKGQDGLDLQQHSRRGGNFADAAALLQVFQGVHREEWERTLNELRYTALRQFLPAHAVPDVLRRLQNCQALAQGTTEGIKYPDGQLPPALLRQDPHQIIGAGQSAGQHDGDDAVIAPLHDPPEGLAHILCGRQGGLG